ncbi:MAG: GIY-YIG nuclease family protein [Planctomycetota bacterium]|nr:GIY-YIG nuclease family protein [Planctomycetota bacterium]
MGEVIASLGILLLGIIGGAVAIYVLIASREREARELLDRARREREDNAARSSHLSNQEKRLSEERREFLGERSKFDQRRVTVEELEQESRLLKQQLQNQTVGYRALEYRIEQQQLRETQLQELASRYVRENARWIKAILTPGSYDICRRRMQEVIQRCRSAGVDYTKSQENSDLDQLRKDYEAAVQAAADREEQAQIRARFREEQRRQRELQEEIDAAEAEKQALRKAIERVQRETHAQHSAEIEELQRQLAEAEARSRRATSQAELTKQGHVYVISNIGAFGEGVFKIGMTRRLIPTERVDELGGAAVPFEFDIHMMIQCDDAPKLESTLHDCLHKHRVNRVNPRKEFFRTDIETIRRFVEENHGTVECIAIPEASDYRNGLNLSDEDQETIEEIFRQRARMDDDDDDLAMGADAQTDDATER